MEHRSIDTIRTYVAAFGLLLGLVCLLTPQTATSTAVPMRESRSLASAAIYAAHCAVCHGRDGRARTSKGKRVGATDFTSDWNTDEARGIRIITNGKSEMPSFKRKLSASEIRSVFQYVLTFRR